VISSCIRSRRNRHRDEENESCCSLLLGSSVFEVGSNSGASEDSVVVALQQRELVESANHLADTMDDIEDGQISVGELWEKKGEEEEEEMLGQVLCVRCSGEGDG
jgi:hypothetical protein